MDVVQTSTYTYPSRRAKHLKFPPNFTNNPDIQQTRLGRVATKITAQPVSSAQLSSAQLAPSDSALLGYLPCACPPPYGIRLFFKVHTCICTMHAHT